MEAVFVIFGNYNAETLYLRKDVFLSDEGANFVCDIKRLKCADEVVSLFEYFNYFAGAHCVMGEFRLA